MHLAGISTKSDLIGNGGEGDIRLQLPDIFVRPYVFAGLGWMHYSVTDYNTNTTRLAKTDDVMTVPLGAGLTLRAPFGGTFDVRGTFRAAYYDNIFNGLYAGTGANAHLHTWNVDARLGWEF